MARNLKLICETNNIETQKKDRKLYITGLFQQAETKNSNGRVYPKKLLKEQVTKLQTKIERKALFGQLGHPSDPSGNPSMISHRIDELRWSGNDLYGKALVLNTNEGRNLRAIIEAGSQIMVSSRSVGEWDRETGIVSEDGFSLLSFDIVTLGGVSDAYVQGVYEGQTWSPCQISQILKEQEESGEERQCICQKCWKTVTTFRDCSMELCPVCHKEMNNFPDEKRLNKEPAKVYTCYCENCQEYLRFRNRKCSEVSCPTCKLKLKQEKVEDSQEIFQSQIKEWKLVIREREF